MAAHDFDADVSGEYEVEVLDLDGDVLAAYLTYRDAIDPHNRISSWGVSVQYHIDTGGVSCSPTAETVKEWRWPVIAVAYKIGGFNGVFPEPESIVGYVAAERLGLNPERPVFLCPMGLTKTPVGHGCDYNTPLKANEKRLRRRKNESKIVNPIDDHVDGVARTRVVGGNVQNFPRRQTQVILKFDGDSCAQAHGCLVNRYRACGRSTGV